MILQVGEKVYLFQQAFMLKFRGFESNDDRIEIQKEFPSLVETKMFESNYDRIEIPYELQCKHLPVSLNRTTIELK